MPRQIVQCEVVWVVSVGYSGNELSPNYSTMGEFDTEEDANAALTNAGFTLYGTWKDRTGYGHAYVSRILREIK